jgi:hypothetical protein
MYENFLLLHKYQSALSPLYTHPRLSMTGVAEGIGAAAGVAGLYNTAITWFDHIYIAKQAAPRLQSLLVKLDNAQLRLTRWGKAAGLTGRRITDEESVKNSYSFQLDEEQERQAIQTFETVATIFEECQNFVTLNAKARVAATPASKRTRSTLSKQPA